MGLFSRKTDDTKARIEELKKKIQAEQQAYTTAAKEQPRAPAAPPPPPEPAPAPVQEVVVEERTPAPVAQPVYEQPAPVQHQRQHPEPRIREHISYHDPRPPAPRVHEQLHDASHGIVLDLGEGMSLNVPVKPRMNLDEFLGVANKVRELQRLQQRPGFR
jgi:hypothetical protein